MTETMQKGGTARLDARKSGAFKIGGDTEIHRLGFGAMRVTGRGIWGPPNDRAEALRTLKRVPELGIDFIDTADSYGPDVSEQLIREALYPYSGILIATKAGFRRPGPSVWEMDGRPDHLRKQAIKSREQLGVEQIGLWQLHRIDTKVPRDEQFAEVKSLLDDGSHPACGLERGVGGRHRSRVESVQSGNGAEPLQPRRSWQRSCARLLREARYRLHPVVSARRR
jgi:pyridoxine 4-dehydrogenase